MAEYRTKVVEVEAWDSSVETPPEAPVRESGSQREIYDRLHDTWIKYDPGDFIIRGLAGEFYPCKPETFWKKYEPVV